MLRVALRSAVVAQRAGLSRTANTLPNPAIHHFVRHESSEAGKDAPDTQTILEKKNDMIRDWDARVLSYEEVKPRTLEPGVDKYLIDVREPDEVAQGALPSAVNLPLSTLAEALHLNPLNFKEKFGFDKPQHDQEIVFYCRSGKRAFTACDVAKRNGYTNLYNYEGSWLDWVQREGGNKTQ